MKVLKGPGGTEVTGEEVVTLEEWDATIDGTDSVETSSGIVKAGVVNVTIVLGLAESRTY